MENYYKPLLEENSVAAYYDIVDNWFYINWFGDQTLKSRMHAYDQVLEYFKIADCSKILNDNSTSTSNWTDCALWLTNDWLPRAEACGVKTIAWVYSSNSEVRQTAEEMLSRISGNTIIIAFEQLEDAKTWLHSV